MKKGEISRGKMIAATAELLQKQGYHGTGLKQILELAKAPKGSLYFHFPGGKEQLACEAMRQSGETLAQRISDTIEGEQDLSRAITAVIDLLAADLEESNFENGCPVATVALEAAATSEAVRTTCEEHYRSWQSLLEARITASGFPAAIAEQGAMAALCAIEGALLLARVYRSVAPLRAVATQLQLMLASASALQPAK